MFLFYLFIYCHVVGVIQAKPIAIPGVDDTMGDGAAVEFSDLPDSPSATAGDMVRANAN